MRILGIDPGSRHTGYGVLELAEGRAAVLSHGRISPPARDAMAARLAALVDGLSEVVDRWQPDVAVLETPFHGVNARSLVVLAQARGALLGTLGRATVTVAEYSPSEVKTAVTGYGRADKAQVARMVATILGLAEPPQADEADALAIALCYAHRQRIDRLSRRTSR